MEPVAGEAATVDNAGAAASQEAAGRRYGRQKYPHAVADTQMIVTSGLAAEGHVDMDALPDAPYRLFGVLDRNHTGPALALAEHHAEDPLAPVSRIVHAIDDAPWAPLLRGDLRRRLESLPGAPPVPEDWLDH